MNSAILGSYRTGSKMEDFISLVFAVYTEGQGSKQ